MAAQIVERARTRREIRTRETEGGAKVGESLIRTFSGDAWTTGDVTTYGVGSKTEELLQLTMFDSTSSDAELKLRSCGMDWVVVEFDEPWRYTLLSGMGRVATTTKYYCCS